MGVSAQIINVQSRIELSQLGQDLFKDESVFIFWAQKVHVTHSCQAPGKIFFVFTLDLLRPCLDCPLA